MGFLYCFKIAQTDSRLTYGPTTLSVDTPCKTEDPTIVNLRDCNRGFHFSAIFHIANVMPLADRCSISRLTVQFQSGLFGGFNDPVEVTLRWFLPS